MAKTKLEVIFIENTDTKPGFRVLGDFFADSDGPAPTMLHIGAIGEFQNVELPEKVFSGRILDKSILYTLTDTGGKNLGFCYPNYAHSSIVIGRTRPEIC